MHKIEHCCRPKPHVVLHTIDIVGEREKSAKIMIHRMKYDLIVREFGHRKYRIEFDEKSQIFARHSSQTSPVKSAIMMSSPESKFFDFFSF